MFRTYFCCKPPGPGGRHVEISARRGIEPRLDGQLLWREEETAGARQGEEDLVGGSIDGHPIQSPVAVEVPEHLDVCTNLARPILWVRKERVAEEHADRKEHQHRGGKRGAYSSSLIRRWSHRSPPSPRQRDRSHFRTLLRLREQGIGRSALYVTTSQDEIAGNIRPSSRVNNHFLHPARRGRCSFRPGSPG